jgi:hypothetical protein
LIIRELEGGERADALRRTALDVVVAGKGGDGISAAHGLRESVIVLHHGGEPYAVWLLEGGGKQERIGAGEDLKTLCRERGWTTE